MARVAEWLGTPLMPWQRAAVDVALEVDPANGRLFYRQVVVSTMRQVGKTTMCLPVWLQRCISWPDQRVAWTMQSAQDAAGKWALEHVPAIESSPKVHGLVWPGSKGIRRQNGSEHVSFKNGSVQTLLASQPSSGHGRVVDLAMVDEAVFQVDDRLEQALRPAMKTRNRPGLPGAQLWVVSTVGPVGEGEWFHRLLDSARTAVQMGACEEERVCLVDYGAPDDADPGDPDVWRRAIPALGVTIELETVAGEWRDALRTDNVAGFRRQALNQRTEQRAAPAIAPEVWEACADPESAPTGRVVFGLAVSADRQWASIGVAGRRADGLEHVELVERRAGVEWVPARLATLLRTPGAVLVADPSGPAAPLLTAVGDVVACSGRSWASACQGFADAVVGGRLRHRGQVELAVALAGAHRRPVGDGGWCWARKSSAVDVSAIEAVTLARFVLAAVPAKPSALGSVF